MFVLYSFRLILLKKVFLKFAQLSLKDVFNIIRLETCYNKIIVFIQVDKDQFDKILGFIKAGKSEGAKLAVGGHRHGDKGFFIEVRMSQLRLFPHHTIFILWFVLKVDKQTQRKVKIFHLIESLKYKLYNKACSFFKDVFQTFNSRQMSCFKSKLFSGFEVQVEEFLNVLTADRVLRRVRRHEDLP